MTHLQHSDRNISPADYAHLAPDQMLVTSIFYTIQGEGPFAGCPAVFIRLAGCNRGRKLDMGCAFCDTKFHFDAGMVLSFGSILAQVKARTPFFSPEPYSKPMVVITGGEPMLQNNIVGLIEILRYHEPRRAIQIESNGDRLPKGWNDQIASKVTLVVSPKAVNNKYRRPADSVLWSRRIFKFVISADESSAYYSVPQWAAEVSGPDHVFVSPLTVYKRDVGEGEIPVMWDRDLVDHAATAANYKHAAQLSLKNGYRMSIQQHLYYGLE